MVRSRLEYANSVWNPYRLENIKKNLKKFKGVLQN